jgi:glycerol-3-phosphate dehydrogenase
VSATPYNRESTWERLGQERFDLVIIGGGVIGAGTARDAALRGLRVAVIDADDTGSGTSSRSSKLIHGGLRYLEQGDFSLVFESVSERRVMLNIAPHLVRPLGFLFPIYNTSPVKLAKLRLGLMVYEGLALFRSPKMHRTLSSAEIVDAMPLIRRQGLQGGPLYWDCMTDDARLTLETVVDAAQHGAAILTYGRAVELVRDASGRITAVRVKDMLDRSENPRTVDIAAGAVVNATGPWSDAVRSLGPQESRQLRTTKGVHIVVAAAKVPLEHTIVGTHPRDNRVLFIIPWGDQVYVGTTDTDYEGDPREVSADKADIDYLIEAIHAYFPSANVKPVDITATWAGLRPLIRADGVHPSQVSREHVITVDPDGLISVAGGKLTTHRRMGAEVVGEVLRWLQLTGHPLHGLRAVHTDLIPLPGAVGWPEDDDGSKVARLVAEEAGARLPEATCRYLADRYGTLAINLVRLAITDQRLLEPLIPGRPEIMAQVDWAVRFEMAVTVTDFMARRTQLFFRDADQGLGAMGVVSGRMGELIGWSAEDRAASEAGYREEVARSRRWRTPAPESA